MADDSVKNYQYKDELPAKRKADRPVVEVFNVGDWEEKDYLAAKNNLIQIDKKSFDLLLDERMRKFDDMDCRP